MSVFLLWIGAAMVLAGCGGEGTGPEAIPVPPGIDLEDVLRKNTLGVAYLERHRYGKAQEEFAAVVEMTPEWAVGHVNMGIALMNLRKNPEALESFERALRFDPGNPNAHYSMGIIYRNLARTDEAVAAFESLVEAGIENSDVYYNLGLLHFRSHRNQEARQALKRSIELDPFNASAHFKLATVLLTLGEKEAGERRMDRFREISDGGMGRTSGQQYTEQGSYAEAIPSHGAAGEVSATGSGFAVRFVDITAEAGISFRHGGPGPAGREAGSIAYLGSGAAWADADGDGDPDLYLTNIGGPNAFYRNQGDGTFQEVAGAAGIADPGDGMAAYFGDYDNDLHPDLFVANLGPDRLYRNRGDGTFEEVGTSAGIAGGGSSMGAAFADLDHDGDLDLYVTGYGACRGDPGDIGIANRFYRNNGLGKFREMALETEISGGRKRSIGVVFTDFDNDRDIDMLFWNDGEPPELLTNLREGRFLDLAHDLGLPAGGRLRGGVAADLNKDGFMDLVLTGWGVPARVFVNRAGKGYEPDDRAGRILASTARWAGSTGVQVADFDNDGFLDIFLVGETVSGGGACLLMRGLGAAGFEDVTVAAGPTGVIPAAPRAVALADHDGDGDPDILVTSNGGPAVLLENRGGEANRSLQVVTWGTNSNRDGIGTKVEIQAGSLWQKQEVSGGSGYLSQNDRRITFGLGERTQADLVRFLWPSGVLQAELERPAGTPLEIEELDRKGSSCPTLFAWNGQRYEFVADFLGVGGIGFLVRPWIYSQPDPTEYLKLEPVRIRPTAGEYRLSIVGQFEEAIYIDAVRLVAVDHPEGTEVYPNERFSVGTPPPDNKIHRIRDRYHPVAARDHQGRDVGDRLLQVDRDYVEGFPLQPFAGFAETHDLSFRFRGLPGIANWVLYLHGWVDYEYSSSTLAAHQAGIELLPPVLEISDRNGKPWKTFPGMGFPAGMPRMMTFEIPGPLPGPDPQFRITTNMRIYWDQIFLAPAEPQTPIRITRLGASRAVLRHIGFPREFSPDGGEPLLYDYHRPEIGYPWKVMTGDYTRYGPVTELVGEADDRFVIMGHGEEIALSFDAGLLPDLEPGWKRSFLFFADGFCKDMDPNTAHPDSVEPLPFHAMTDYPYPFDEKYPDGPEHREYRKIYNSRKK